MFLDEQPWQKVVTFNSMLPTMWKQNWEKQYILFLTFSENIQKNKFWPNLTFGQIWSNLVKFLFFYFLLLCFFIIFYFFVLKQFQRWKSGHNLLSRLQSRQHPMLIPWIHSEFESGKPVPQMVSYQLCFILEWILGRWFEIQNSKTPMAAEPLEQNKIQTISYKDLKGNWKIFPWL